jgi:formate/nitrite transporter FocA (FNT family)
MKAILAGMLIVVGAVTYLTIGGIAGAVLFSIGLITILVFKLDLFTGKAGLLFQQKIGLGDLVEIWILNLIGTGIAAWGIYMTPLSAALYPKAQAIM